MSRSLALVSVWICATGLTAAWAQKSHGTGVGGGHGAPPQFPAAAAHSGPKTTAGHTAAARTSKAQTTAVFTKVSDNPALSSRIQPLLPAGMTLQSAATGFKNQGQFLAALHVSRNLNIPFAQLKAEITGANHSSLGQAIGILRPGLGSDSVKSDVKLARLQARQDVRSASSDSRMSIATRISRNTGLATRIQALVPSGMSLQAATAGFRSEGQFIAALHVSRNLKIPCY
jgi:hypothetical protein